MFWKARQTSQLRSSDRPEEVEHVSSTHTNLLFHIVFSTKYRRDLITPEIQPRLYEYIGGIVRDQHGSLLEIGGIANHVHLLAKLSPRIAFSDAIRVVKANSSKWLNETFQPKHTFRWQRGYGAFSVSLSSVPAVTQYIQNQESHHTKRTFEDEYRAMLIRHGIQFEERYLFEDEHFQ
ncbi:IS200/IS605 family transposase [Stieleria varia]|uniref:Transposase IS200 like protein n=1 Tax=Stieleria varia TaxID=2528005 RepID=A0A5C6B3N9_9BACT|nr:IS200/IS605 family transposase [Stieleria varia]TWU05886.1 Transposase IS200 like protein [Stieleria varia]